MQHSQPVIAEMLQALDAKLSGKEKITQNVKYLSFREKLVGEKTSTLGLISQELTNAILLDSTENILPVLESIASTNELNDAMVLVFTDGRNLELNNSDTQNLMDNLLARRSEFHFFGPVNVWCDEKQAVAFSGDSQILSKDGTMSACNEFQQSNFINDVGQVNVDKLLKLALMTGGLIWPIENFASKGRDAPNAMQDLIEVTSDKLSEILLLKGEKLLSAIINYPKNAVVGQTVYFEIKDSFHVQGVGEVTSWRWDFDNDGQFEDAGKFVSTSFDESGTFVISLELANDDNPAVVRVLELPVRVSE
uniref:PKD domain-containing protein n=1 Tax=Ningiella ruwaisensis TaxID=2364274 RepID=UPI0010A067F8|nr:PKD domain-containing protein [Ningiella ruwaisensis]